MAGYDRARLQAIAWGKDTGYGLHGALPQRIVVGRAETRQHVEYDILHDVGR